MRLFDQRLAIVPQLTAPLLNMLPGNVVTASAIGDKRAVSPGFHDNPQLLCVGPSRRRSTPDKISCRT